MTRYEVYMWGILGLGLYWKHIKDDIYSFILVIQLIVFES